ncbi:BLUF domain-containing protein [Sphingomonas sp. 1P08PE]|uniref:BLUF domain-containing protein n=1 Tax=Sphingomonas sp. 1P08PE TaxID=554122 RepID=UPI0039A24EA5
MQQLLYISSVHPGAAATIDAAGILHASRRNNARVGVTGLLFFDGKRFLQVLEGEPQAVEQTFARIQHDPRHRALVVLSHRTIETREFGEWAMAYRQPGDDGGAVVERLRELTVHAPPSVQATFASFAGVRRAA